MPESGRSCGRSLVHRRPPVRIVVPAAVWAIALLRPLGLSVNGRGSGSRWGGPGLSRLSLPSTLLLFLRNFPPGTPPWPSLRVLGVRSQARLSCLCLATFSTFTPQRARGPSLPAAGCNSSSDDSSAHLSQARPVRVLSGWPRWCFGVSHASVSTFLILAQNTLSRSRTFHASPGSSHFFKERSSFSCRWVRGRSLGVCRRRTPTATCPPARVRTRSQACEGAGGVSCTHGVCPSLVH